MKKILVTLFTLMAFLMFAAASPAYAKKAAPAPVAVSPAYSWNGLYVGINGGGGFGTGRHNFNAAGTTTGDYDVSGGVVGGTIGVNMPITSSFFTPRDVWVLGLEGDFNWSNIEGAAPCPNPAFSCETKNTWFATIRPRLGYAVGNLLPYVTGGFAVGDVEGGIPTFGSRRSTNLGWAGGAGIEANVLDNWSIKAEYLFVDLGEFNCGSDCTATFDDHVSFNAHVIRAGLNYQFNWGYFR